MRTPPVRESYALLGRIRIGASSKNEKGKKIPKRLETFRITSQDRAALSIAAALYGGEVTPWEDAPSREEWQVFTAVNALRVTVLGTRSLRSHYEQWDRDQCTWRCDGQCVLKAPTIEQVGSLCTCTDTPEAPCKLVVRMDCTLPDVSEYGAWRLTSHGINATAELLGTARLLAARGVRPDAAFGALLRLDQQRSGGRLVRVPRLIVAHAAMGVAAAPTLTLTPESAAQDAEDIFGVAEALRTPTLHERPQIVAPSPAAGQQERLALVEAIDATLLAGGGSPERYWPRICSRYGIETAAHLALGQLRDIRDSVRAEAEMRTRPLLSPAAPEAAAVGDENTPF